MPPPIILLIYTYPILHIYPYPAVLQETCELPLEVQMERLSDMVIRVGKVLNNGDSSFLPLGLPLSTPRFTPFYP